MGKINDALADYLNDPEDAEPDDDVWDGMKDDEQADQHPTGLSMAEFVSKSHAISTSLHKKIKKQLSEDGNWSLKISDEGDGFGLKCYQGGMETPPPTNAEEALFALLVLASMAMHMTVSLGNNLDKLKMGNPMEEAVQHIYAAYGSLHTILNSMELKYGRKEK